MIKKLGKQRLVKYLETKAPDQIRKIVKKKNLGQSLGINRSIKPISKGGQEGAVELVGDPRTKDGISVRKFYDVEDSPITSTSQLIQKVKTLKILNSDPRTKGLFAKHVPNSVKISPNKKVVSTNAEYVPSASSIAKTENIAAKAQARAEIVLGRRLVDIQGNPGNTKAKVIDFIDSKSMTTYPELSAFRKLNPKKKVSDRMVKGLKLHPKTSDRASWVDKRNLDDPVLSTKGLGKSPKKVGDGVGEVFGLRDKMQSYAHSKYVKTKEDVLTELKKKFYAKNK